jgi:hypothetical protein
MGACFFITKNLAYIIPTAAKATVRIIWIRFASVINE